MTLKERQEVLARLAAGEILSLKDEEIGANRFDIGVNAWFKIAMVLKIPAPRVDNVLQTLIQHLQDSDLTINFRAPDFFANVPTGSYLNTWQQGNSGLGYLATRENVEERLFDYSNTSGRSASPSILNRIQTLGSRFTNTGANNPFFQAAMRPKYGALNYTGDKEGAANSYGRSYLILKEHVKHNATFTYKDSFFYGTSPNLADETANFHNLDRLIANMGPDKLTKLYNAATGSSLPIPTQTVGRYFEAQLHSDIQFNRDVKTICVENREVGGNNDLRKKINKFAQKNGIMLRFY